MSNSNTNLQTQTSSVLQNVTVSSCSNSNIQEKTQLSRSRCMHSLKEIKSLFKFLSETLQDYGTMPIFKRTFSQDLDLQEQHLNKDILSRTDCTTTLTDLHQQSLKPCFPSEFETQEDHSHQTQAVNTDSLKVDLVVKQNSCSEKEDSNSETASSKSAKECSLNSETQDDLQIDDLKALDRTWIQTGIHRHSLVKMLFTLQGKALDADLVDTESIRTDSTVSKSSSSFSDSKNIVCSTCHKCVFNANHDACITKLLKEVNSRAKIQSNKTTNSNKPVDQKSHTQKPSRQIFTGHRFSPNKTSAVSEKTSPRSDLRWKPTGRIFKSVGLRWIPTGKLFDSCTSKVDSEPPHGSNVDIPHIHECKQTLDLSAGTSLNGQKQQRIDLSAGALYNVKQENLRPRTTVSTEVHQAAETVTTSNELDLLFGPLFDEYFNGENQVVLKSSAVTTTDASNKRQQQPDSTSSTSTLATTVTANGNFDL
ncbi:hypothetical protein Tco_0006575 [Tanacetum coccineum]